MPKINPKDYPFNYVVRFPDDDKRGREDFERYNDAEEFVKANWPELVISDDWNKDDELAREMVFLDGFSKIAWQPEAREEVESLLMRCDLDSGEGEKLHFEAVSIAEGQVTIERCRDAYHEACMDAHLDARFDAMDAEMNDSSDEVDNDRCETCERPGGVGTDTIHCHACQTTFDADELDDEEGPSQTYEVKPFVDPFESVKLAAMNIQEGEDSITLHDVHHLRGWSKGMIRKFLNHPENADGLVSLGKVLEFEDSRPFKKRMVKLRQHLANGLNRPTLK